MKLRRPECSLLLVLFAVAVQLTTIYAEPVLFPDNPEYPAYKDRRTTTTRAPMVVRDPRRHKTRIRGGLDPFQKNRLLNTPNDRNSQQARSGRQFRYDRRQQPGQSPRPTSLIGLLPSLPGGNRQGRTRGGTRGGSDLQSQGSRTLTRTLTTSDGIPVITDTGASISRSCPKATGKFPVMRQCDKYLDCNFNIGYLRSCPPGTKYNYRTTLCDFPYRVECVDDFELYQGAIDGSAAARSSSLPPLTPSVMERPTARFNADGSVSKECPLPAGMFAIPGRCDEFLNCWASRGYVQKCAPGTLFNCHTEKCDFPHKVRCVDRETPQPPMVDLSEFARTGGVAPRSRFGAIMSPPSGQRLRIRGGRAKTQGHVQLYHEGQWNNICENDFTRHMTDTICWDLGYTRGSEELNMKSSSRFKLQYDARLLALQCTGDEMHVFECQKRAMDKCKPMGIKCQENTLSSCPPGYRLFEESCYKVFPKEPMSREDAMARCVDDGGDLLSIHSQEENDFVSEMLQYWPNTGCIHTGGVGVSLRRGRQLWMWEATLEPIQFQRWWPGWNRQTEGQAPSIGSSNKCLILQNEFPSPPLRRRSRPTINEVTRNMNSGYFWWTAGDCLDKLAFICEVPQANIGCMRGMGADYSGEAAATETGQKCLDWNAHAIEEITKQLNIDTVAIGQHNFCRNPDGDDRPWCFVSSRDYEYCDIPRCEVTKETPREIEVALRTSLTTIHEEENNCGTNMFQCRPGECKFFSWVCDGEEDCSNGRDEVGCHNHLDDYKRTSRVKLVGYDVEKWLFTDEQTCARRCSETKDFLCRAFNYMNADQTCYLLDSNIALSGATKPDAEYELYELLSEIPDCSNQFICPGGKCINRTQVCDGKRDCLSNEDEKKCHTALEFDIRLVGGKTPNEGRIEVKAKGSWGVVCDDLFSIVDGDVFCRHLGYPLGAAEVITNAGFGSGNGRFKMDDINCRGDEQKVTECDFAGWGKSDCTEAEVAGVRCREAGQPCTDNQWRCKNSKCIDLVYVCDAVDDCGDFSDEEDALCKLPLEARLVGGTNSSGRVEVRYKGVWGTVCDDDFDVEDAQVMCRMLGFEGAAIVHKTTEFGPGKGQIWLDQISCKGNEKSIDECYHLPWGQSNCAHEEDVGIECTVGSRSIHSSISRTQPERPQTILPKQCGRRIVPDTPIIPTDQNPKIVNGKVTQPGSHPWMVGVRIKAGAETAHWCGAVIISEYHIVSAAHCLLDYPQQVYVLRVGDYDNQVNDPEEQEFTIDRMYPHPDFNKGTYLNNDLVIIRVKPVGGRGIRFGPSVQPVCLTPPNVPYEPGKKCTIAGWGSTGRRAGYARRLQSVSLPLLPISTCTAPYVYGERKITAGMYCAGYLEGGIDTCQGDSGGPMVCDHQGANILYGVTSWGQGCARPNKPGVYTKLTSYLTWIYRTLQEDSRR